MVSYENIFLKFGQELRTIRREWLPPHLTGYAQVHTHGLVYSMVKAGSPTNKVLSLIQIL